MQILYDDHRRAVGGNRLEEATPCMERLLARRAPTGADPNQRQQPRLEPVALLDVGEHFLELRRRDFRRVRLEDPGMRFHEFAQRPERDAFSIRRAPPLPPADQLCSFVDVAGQLGAQPALADTWLADERHHLDGRIARAPVEEALQERLLDLASDERRRRGLDAVGSDSCPRLYGAIDAHRLCLALCLDRRQRFVREHALGLPKRLLRYSDRIHRRARLNPRRSVDDVARDDRLALVRASLEQHDSLARIDPDPDLKVELRAALVQLSNRLEDPQPRPHRALRVVLVRHRRTEHRHHRVADELLDGPAVALEFASDSLVVGADAGANILRVGLLRGLGETDEIAEENGDDLPLFAGHRIDGRGQGGTALATELRLSGVLVATP